MSEGIKSAAIVTFILSALFGLGLAVVFLIRFLVAILSAPFR